MVLMTEHGHFSIPDAFYVVLLLIAIVVLLRLLGVYI